MAFNNNIWYTYENVLISMESAKTLRFSTYKRDGFIDILQTSSLYTLQAESCHCCLFFRSISSACFCDFILGMKDKIGLRNKRKRSIFVSRI